MNYEHIVEGAKRYSLEDNIYDLATLMIAKHGTFSKEAVAGIFVLIFSWNRDFYSPPNSALRKPIKVLDQHVAQFETALQTEKDYIQALQAKDIADTDYTVRIEPLNVTIEGAIAHLFSRFSEVLGPTGALESSSSIATQTDSIVGHADTEGL